MTTCMSIWSLNPPYVLVTHWLRSASLLVSVLLTLVAAGCGKPAPEQTIIGFWTMDKLETEKTNPFMAAAPGMVWYEFKAGGSYGEGFPGSAKTGNWKLVKNENGMLTVEVTREGRNDPEIIEVSALTKDHITVNYPQGLGVIHLKRASGPSPAPSPSTTSQNSTVPMIAELKGHHGNVGAMAFSHDGKFLACGSWHQFKVWDIPGRKELASVKMDGIVGTVAILPDGKTLLTQAGGGEIKLWEIPSGTEKAKLRGPGTGGTALTLSPDGKTVAAARVGHGIVLRDLNWNEIQTLKTGLDIDDLAFTPDGMSLISTDAWSSVVNIWDVGSGKVRKSLPAADKGPEIMISLSADGKVLAVARGKVAKVWSLLTEQEIAIIQEPPDMIDKLALSPDGKVLAMSKVMAKAVFLVDVGTQKELAALKCRYRVESVAFSPDGKILATSDGETASDPTDVKLWDLSKLAPAK